jgi:hypothetical protein
MADNIETRLAALEIEREETETAMADIRAQLDVHHDDKAWRSRAKAALRYKGIDHQATLREIGALKREQKARDQSDRAFPDRFVDIAKVVLPAETFNKIRDLALAGLTVVVTAEQVKS